MTAPRRPLAVVLAVTFAVAFAAACAPPPTTVVGEYSGRVQGGTLAVAPFSPEHRLDIPRLPGEDRAAAERRYARHFRHALAREIQRQTRFERVVVDDYAGAPALEMRRFNQRRYDGAAFGARRGRDFSIATPTPGQPVRMEGGTPDFVLFLGDAEIEAVRGKLLPGTIEMPHRVSFVLWDNRTGEPVLFNRADGMLTLNVEPLPEGTPLDEQMAHARYLDGLREYVGSMFEATPFFAASN